VTHTEPTGDCTGTPKRKGLRLRCDTATSIMRARAACLQRSINASLPRTLAECELLAACIALPLLGHMLRWMISDTGMQHFHGTPAQRTGALRIPIAPDYSGRLVCHRLQNVLREVHSVNGGRFACAARRCVSILLWRRPSFIVNTALPHMTIAMDRRQFMIVMITVTVATAHIGDSAHQCAAALYQEAPKTERPDGRPDPHQHEPGGCGWTL
jgi:hypothetical protein